MYLKAIYLVLSLLCLVNGLAVIDAPINDLIELSARFVVFCSLWVVGLGFLEGALERD